MSAEDYDLIDSMLPAGKEIFTVSELADHMRLRPSHVEESFYRCLLPGFGCHQKFSELREKVGGIRIPRFAAVLWLMEMSNFDGEMVLEQIERIARDHLADSQRKQLSKSLITPKR